MNTYPGCYPCLVRHSTDAVRLATGDIEQQKRILKKVMQMLADESLVVTPVRLTAKIHTIIQSETGNKDCYRTLKDKCNDRTLQLLPGLKRLLNRAWTLCPRILAAI